MSSAFRSPVAPRRGVGVKGPGTSTAARASQVDMETRALGTMLLLCLAPGLFACGPNRAAEQVGPRPAQVEAALGRARAAADELGHRLLTELAQRLDSDGPAAAIGVCSQIAPEAAAEISREGVRIRRVSLRPRNPGNAADAWERAWLERFAGVVAGGGEPSEVHEIDESGGELRFVRPIRTGAVCVSCHGPVEDLDAGVRRRLAELYERDQATGYSVGDLRGAFSVRVRLAAADAS